MPLSDQFPRVAIDQIEIPFEFRQRQRERDSQGRVATGHCEPSIARLGVLMPLLVELAPGPRWILVSGECRLQSCRNLVERGTLVAASGQDLTTIPVRLASDLTPLESQLLELTENAKRKDLAWQDLVQSVAGIHRLCRELDPDWTLGETGEVASLTTGTVSMYLRVQGELGDPRVESCGTVREAYNVLTRRDQRALGDALDELASVPVVMEEAEAAQALVGRALTPAQIVPLQGTSRVVVPGEALAGASPEAILNEDFLQWAPRYSGPGFNFIHCDFPYVVDPFGGEQGRGAEPSVLPYASSEEIYYALVECLCLNLDRLMSLSGHLMFWFSDRHELSGGSETRRLFRALAPDLEFTPFPLIWHKSDNKGIAGDSRRHPRHVYETALLASRGRRQLIQTRADLYASPTDRSLHASTKPEPMLRHFMEMLVDGETRMLDPTCGSGASLRAAESLGANVLGLELDPEICAVARKALRDKRVMREASKGGLGL